MSRVIALTSRGAELILLDEFWKVRNNRFSGSLRTVEAIIIKKLLIQTYLTVSYQTKGVYS
jgi:hypothetical protein